MRNEERFKVGGYLFGNAEDVKQAKEEQGTIRFLEQKINFEDVQMTLKIYDKALQERVFKTPVGFEFMRRIQREMIRRGLPEEKIKAIALYQVYSKKEEKRPIRIIKKKEKPDKTKVQLRTSLWINFALTVVVVGMFVLSLIGEAPNIVNYRHRIQNEYSAWEQELTERENRIRDRERELELE